MFNVKGHDRLAGTRQRKFTENRSKNRIKFTKRSKIISKRPDYYLVHYEHTLYRKTR